MLLFKLLFEINGKLLSLAISRDFFNSEDVKPLVNIKFVSFGKWLPKLFKVLLCANTFVRKLIPFAFWYWYWNSAFKLATSTLLGHSLAHALQLKHKSKTSFNSL